MLNVNPKKSINSVITRPVEEVSYDAEYVREVDGGTSICEISIRSVKDNSEILHEYICPPSDFILNDWRQKKGYSEEKLANGKTIEELDNLLKHLLPHMIVIFWNSEFDLKKYPNLSTYCLATRCAMRRYSERFGSWNPSFGNNSFVSLNDAAAQIGIHPEPGQYFHTASFDSLVTAEAWKYCDHNDLPKPTVYPDLVFRKEQDIKTGQKLTGDTDPSLNKKSLELVDQTKKEKDILF